MLASHRIIIIVVACLLAAPCFAQSQPEGKDVLLQVASKPLPKLTYKDEHGQPAVVDAAGAKLTILHYWATWCVPCIAELPVLDAVYAKYSTRGLRVLTFSVDTDQEKVVRFLAANEINHLPPYLDDNNASFMALELSGLPSSIFVNSKGEEVTREAGPIVWTDPSVIKFIEASLK